MSAGRSGGFAPCDADPATACQAASSEAQVCSIAEF